MCGRAHLSSDVSEIKLVFSIPPERPTPNFSGSWNVAPTDSLPIVRYDARAGERTLDLMRWGLAPYSAKDIKVGFSNINAKAETWLGELTADPDRLKGLLASYPANNMVIWPVDRRVGNVKNNDPPLIEPIALAEANRLAASAAGAGGSPIAT
jgi:putative SOS response-associated peptidase YedK